MDCRHPSLVYVGEMGEAVWTQWVVGWDWHQVVLPWGHLFSFSAAWHFLGKEPFKKHPQV